MDKQLIFDALIVLVMIGGFFYMSRRHDTEEREHEKYVKWASREAKAARNHAAQCNGRAAVLAKILEDKGIKFDADPESYIEQNDANSNQKDSL